MKKLFLIAALSAIGTALFAQNTTQPNAPAPVPSEPTVKPTKPGTPDPVIYLKDGKPVDATQSSEKANPTVSPAKPAEPKGSVAPAPAKPSDPKAAPATPTSKQKAAKKKGKTTNEKDIKTTSPAIEDVQKPLE